MKITIPLESIEKLSTYLTADVDPTGFTVQFAFTQGATRPTTWVAGTWSGAAVPVNNGFRVRALTPDIGTGSLDLAEGIWKVWARINTGGEVPVIEVGEFVIN